MTVTFDSQVQYNYTDAYNNIVAFVKASPDLSPAQRDDCLEALATIAPGMQQQTGTTTSTPVTPPSTGVLPPPGNPVSNFSALP